jgi:hypothetical protein
MAGWPPNHADRAETLIHANIYGLPNRFGKLKCWQAEVKRGAPVAAQKQMAEGRVTPSNCSRGDFTPNALASESFR